MTAQGNSMKIDEMIELLENRLNAPKALFEQRATEMLLDKKIVEANECIDKIALAALKAHKAGYRMFTYDYSERDLVEADCELSKILEGLK